MTKVILISGAAGFLGKNLIKNIVLNNSASEIIVLDNFITSDPDQFDKFKSKLNPDIKITLFDFDITNPKMIPFIKERYQTINEIYHLASLASPIAYKKYPLKTLDTGYIGTKNLLELAYHYNSKLLLASTSEVYGDAQVSPQTESYYGNVNSYGARSSYDESKRVAEALCYTYINKYNLDIKIARIFNTYGPEMSMNDGRIITEIIKHSICDTELTIFGDGTQTRSICYVDNTVDMLIRLMGSDCNIPVNIGNNKEMSVNDIVNITKSCYHQLIKNNEKYKNLKINDLKIQYIELTQDDPLIRQPCLKLNQQILGKTDYISMEQGITNTIQFFLDN
jgi:nucleoside-diphosphate-sugar epimerase